MKVRIYRMAQNVMQSGKGRQAPWCLEFLDNITNNIIKADLLNQQCLKFKTLDMAIKYVETLKIEYQVSLSSASKKHIKSYADNFRYDRIGSWTH